MNKNQIQIEEMLYINSREKIMTWLNYCSFCALFSPPYEVGLCHHTPENDSLESCQAFQELDMKEVNRRILQMKDVNQKDIFDRKKAKQKYVKPEIKFLSVEEFKSHLLQE